MAQVNKISSFKSFSEVKNQEATIKLRETNNAKRQETVGKIGSILDEMGLTSLSELDEEKKQALINKMFGNVSEYEADDIEAAVNKLGAPKKIGEGNAFGDSVRKAKEAGKKEFEFDGKTYKVKEDNASEFDVIDDVFEANYNVSRSAIGRMGGLVPIKEMNSLIDCSKAVIEDLYEEGFELDEIIGYIAYRINDKFEGMYESVLNEGRVKAASLLQELIDGNTSRAEGIKMSKDLAEHYLYWLKTSPYGKKNTDLPLYMLIKASFSWGIERGLDPKLKVELEALKAAQMKNESIVNEARTIAKIQYDWSKLTTTMAATAQNWKAAEGPAKEMLLGKLKEMTAQKKALEAELDATIADKDKDIELVVSEAFFRLPKDVIGNELYMATQNLSNLYGRTLAGNDIDAGVIDTVIKALTTVKKSIKKFNSKEEVLGSVYEGFEVHYSDGVRAFKKFGNEKQAIAFAKDLIKSKRSLQFVDVFNANNGFHSTADTNAIVAFWGDGSYTDNVSKGDEKLAAKKIDESLINEGAKFKNTKDFEAFLEEIDGMGESQIKKIMGKDYIDTPGGFRDEADDYDNDIVEYTLSNMGRKDFEALKAWWENNVQESTVNEGDMTKFYDGFKVLNDKTGEMTKFKYIKGTKNQNVENEAIAKLMKATGSSRANFGVHGFVKKGEWNMDKTPVFESTVNEADSVKSEAISRLADFFRISPYALSKFNFDGNDNIKELTKVLNSTSDEGTKLYYDTCIKLAKKDLGINESTVNEAEKFKSTQDFEEFLEEIDGMPEVRIKRIMGKDYIDTPGGFRDEADDYDNDIVEYTLSNMGRKDFEALKAWWENNVQESLTEGMISPKMANSFKIGNKIKTQKDTYTITGFGSKTGATRDFEAENENGEQFNLRVSLKGATGIQVAVGARNLNFPEQQEMLESVVTEGAAKQFDVDFTAMVKNIKSGYGWIDPEYVADTWENSSTSIDFELVKGEIYKRLIAAKLLAYADDEDEESAGQYVKSLKELGIKESFVNEAVSNPSELTSFINKNESHFAAFLKPKKINTSVEGNKAIIKPASGSFTITVDFDKSTIDSTGKPKHPESTSYVEIIEYIKGNTKFKVLNESAEVNEAEVKSDDEFKEYAMTVLKKAFGDDFDEAKATEVVDGILKKCGDDYGACVGMLTSSLGESVVTEAFDADKRVAELAKLLKKQKFVGSVYPEGDTIKVFVDSGDVGTTMMWDDDEPGKVRMECEDDSYSETIDDNDDVVLNFFSNLDDSVDESVTNEAFDANYWEDYHEDAPIIKNPSGMQLQQEVEDAVEEWNDNNEDGPDNEVTPAGEKKVLKLAKEYVKAKGYICHDVIDAMIAQES